MYTWARAVNTHPALFLVLYSATMPLIITRRNAGHWGGEPERTWRCVSVLVIEEQ